MDWKLPNILSLSRVIIAPFYVILFLSGDVALQQFAIVLYIIGAITDYYDGYFARKFNWVSSFGKFMDPLADKLLTSAAFLSFFYLDIIPLWMVIIILIRDFGTTFLRLFQKNTFTTSYFAKMKTTIQMVFIGAILILFYIIDMYPHSAEAKMLTGWIYSDVTYYLMLIITVITVLTFFDYLKPKKTKV
ncbi:MAG: CDP-diacylglycerol--glycerol-3-phosphate 3-phosphatidyltransferase [Ignavibacteria bacterium GWF2_33_9]|nr:MAG: CDP-diacylglycerol--glycerol-3-phosphate 3-phosphatidyltransferase [Ignavibacteria bacterium GWF2_33_9]